MKTIDEYMALPYTMELIPDTDEGGFVVSFPALKGCLSAGETVEEAVRNAEDAKHEWLLAAIESGMEIPEPGNIELKVRILLNGPHHRCKVVGLAKIARINESNSLGCIVRLRTEDGRLKTKVNPVVSKIIIASLCQFAVTFANTSHKVRLAVDSSRRLAHTEEKRLREPPKLLRRQPLESLRPGIHHVDDDLGTKCTPDFQCRNRCRKRRG